MYCSNCGKKIDDESKFCNYCGSKIDNNNERKIVYEGKIHKCPNCGEIIKSFCTNCPSCGYEFRDVKVSESLKELTYKLSELKDEKQQESLIRNYPIPNTEEDILEFFIITKTNINKCSNMLIIESWNTKLEQIYEKSKILFNSSDKFLEIKKVYLDVKQRIIAQKILNLIINNIIFFIGIFILICAVIVDKTGNNGSLIELVSYIIIISGEIVMLKNTNKIQEYGFAALFGLIIIFLSSLLKNGSLGRLVGYIELIIVIIYFFKMIKNNKIGGK